MTVTEAKKLMRLVNAEDMKKKLIGMGDKEMVSYTTLNKYRRRYEKNVQETSNCLIDEEKL